ncbi:hypothetical protein FQR65_LT08057 [Abscondita terminalis]|nr:hypothetical protein FQR65_LT08057 [Abscondita terminalis]
MIVRKYLAIKQIILWLILLLTFATNVDGIGQVIYAVNCGGDSHVDSFGIHYEKDPLQGRIGIASDYGKRLLIGRVSPNDHILYQTERYHHSTFGYEIPAHTDGDYVLILKFSEVYFNAPDQKVFDVVLNGDHTIVSDLDIFEKVGRGVAHDEYIPFVVSKGRLIVNGEESEIRGGRIRVEFIKGYKDNPKINAIVVMKGTMDNVQKLPPLEPEPVEEYKEEPEVVPKNRRPSGPKQPDPYSLDDSSMMLPVFIAIDPKYNAMSFFIIIFLLLTVNYTTAYSNKKLDRIITNVIEKMFKVDDSLAYIYDSFVEIEIPNVVNNQYAVVRCASPTSLIFDKPNSFIIHLSSQKTLNNTTRCLFKSSFFKKPYSIKGKYLVIINENNVINLNQIFEVFWLKNIQQVVVLTFKIKHKVFVKVHTSDPFHEGSDCGRISKVVRSQVYHQNVSIKYPNIYPNIYKCVIWMSSFMGIDHPLRVCYDELIRELTKKINGVYLSAIKPNPDFNPRTSKFITSMVHVENGLVGYKSLYEILSFGYKDSLHFVVRGGKEVPSIKLLIKAFNVQVWIYIVGAYVTTSIALWFIISVINREFLISELAKNFLEVFSATLWGCFSFEPKKAEIRCIFICYLIYHIHIQSGFTCNLVTILTTPQFQSGISNLEELSESNLTIYARKNDEDYFLWIDDSIDSTNNRIKKKIQFPYHSDNSSYQKLLEDLMIKNGGILLTELEIKYFRHKLLSNVRVNIIDTDTIIQKRSLYLVLNAGHYLTNTFQSFFFTMQESGFTQKYMNDVVDNLKHVPELKNLVPLNLKHLLCAFVFLTFGLILSSFIFLLEIVFRITQASEQESKMFKSIIFLLLFLFINYYFVPAYKIKSLDSCVTKLIDTMFEEDDTLSLFYDKLVKVQLPHVIRNPYIIIRSFNPFHFNVSKISGHIMHLHNQDSLVNTFSYLSKTTLIPQQSRNRKFLIIINQQDVRKLNTMFQYLWTFGVHKVAILTYYKMKTDLVTKIHTSNPFHKDNYCGGKVNVIISKDCNCPVVIDFRNMNWNLNKCTISYYKYYNVPNHHPLFFIIYLFFNDVVEKVNGTFKMVHYSKSKFKFPVEVIHSSDYSTVNRGLDFSHIFLRDQFYFVVKKGNEITPIKILFSVFTLKVWIMIIGGISLVWWIISSLNKSEFEIIEFEKITLDVFSATLWGCFSSVPERMELRCIFICYLLYHIHIQTGFTSNLFNVLTTPRFERGITNLEELAESNITIVGHTTVKNYIFERVEHPHSIYSKVKKQMQYQNTVETSNTNIPNLILNENCGFLLMGLDTKFVSFYYKEKLPVALINGDIVSGRVELFYILLTGNFRETLNWFILTLDEAGILTKRQKDVWNFFTVLPKSKKLIPLNLRHVLCAFVFLTLGLILATLVFGVELLLCN